MFDPNHGNKDADGDGQSNLQEYSAGTDPTNSASSFLVIPVTNYLDVGGATNVASGYYRVRIVP